MAATEQLYGQDVIGKTVLTVRADARKGQYRIAVTVRVARVRKYMCKREYEGRLAITPVAGGEAQYLDWITARDVDKVWKYVDSGGMFDGKRIWIEELCKIPQGYRGSIGEHGGAGDIGDVRKSFCLAFETDGTPRSSLLTDGADILTASRIHYIKTFELEPEWHGQGVATPALFLYEAALKKLQGDLALLEGAFMLSPGPTYNATARGRAGEKTTRDKDIGQPTLAGLVERPTLSRLEREAAELESTGRKKEPTNCGSYIWYDGKPYTITPSIPDRVVAEAKLQQQMWLEREKSKLSKTTRGLKTRKQRHAIAQNNGHDVSSAGDGGSSTGVDQDEMGLDERTPNHHSGQTMVDFEHDGDAMDEDYVDRA
ncbi:hypothetical protein CLAFUW4_10725 [Fulvia fulva]|nr:hypothetical protein CLAFUR4_10730 [Fulvia fulva]WPV19731.1 hypothetical protein CLAFUW4_10725 [Fulvia fulva]WPV33813.1 hypothetical protein CLAFUW7_10727 [Fulvia fulva]